MLKDLVVKNRSYRGYDGNFAISREQIEEFLEIARFAASSRNSQPLKYYISCTPERNAEILALTKWAALLPNENLPHPGHAPTAYVVICQDVDLFQRILSVDVGLTAQTILLAAVEQGLGGCMIGAFNKPEISKLLKLPENIQPQLIVAIGKPDENIILTEVKEDNNIDYYRDAEGNHYVPKRPLKDMLLND